MGPEHKAPPPDIQKVINDLKEIRALVDRGRSNHPIRVIGRPLMTFTAVIGVLVIGFGVLAHLLLGSAASLAGLAPTTLVWVLGGLFVVASGVAKTLVVAAASRKVGFDVGQVITSVLTKDYGRILLPIYLLAGCSGVALVEAGLAHMLVGLIILATGAVMVAIPLLMPLKEDTWFGLVYVVLGAVAMFVLPEVPFLKLSAVMGVPLLVGSLLSRSNFPELGQQ